jgi:hypothetical protein
MKNTWRIVAAAAVLAGTLALGASPASANTQACTGVFLLGSKPTVGMLALGAPAVTFTFNFTSGACEPSPPLSANFTITLHGWCETAVGSGTVNGHATNVVATNGELVLTGGVVGVITITPLGVPGDACMYHGFALFGRHAIVTI